MISRPLSSVASLGPHTNKALSRFYVHNTNSLIKKYWMKIYWVICGFKALVNVHGTLIKWAGPNGLTRQNRSNIFQ